MATRVHSATPTVEQYQKYQAAWGWFNEQLFDGTLKRRPKGCEQQAGVVRHTSRLMHDDAGALACVLNEKASRQKDG